MTNSAAQHVVSADGTMVAFERLGSGPPVILVGGAFNDRTSQIAGMPMAEFLAPHFTVISFDRRGRGDTSDANPWDTDREIEDLLALSTEVGGDVCLFGHSSGGALVLEAALGGVPVSKVAVYEPPYSMDDVAETKGRIVHEQLNGLIAAGQREEAVVLWMDYTGMPEEMLTKIRLGPFWPTALRLSPTLPHELAILRHGGSSFVPEHRLGRLLVPVLAMAGSDSPEWMRRASASVANSVSNGRYREFPGSDHAIPPERVAPALIEFFSAADGVMGP